MPVLATHNLGQSFGDFDVFGGITVSIPNDGKIGLVGPNGIGKTTLLRLLAGLDVPSAGEVSRAKETRIGYLRQEAMDAFAGRDNTVYTEMLRVFDNVLEREVQLRELEEYMAAAGSSDTADRLLEEYSQAQHEFEAIGGYEYEMRISQVLQGLGFAQEDWSLPLAHLSGGQKTRALLARLLLEQPDLLILDEPTNHLDVEAIEWLESTLQTWKGALLIVSHDRYFLDRVVNRIWELSRAGIEEYRGNYSAYVLQRQERWERREAEFEAVKERFLKELDYVKRNIARDSTTNMAKGRLRRLIREVKVVQAGGLQALLNKQWGKVMEEVDISDTKWNVADTEQAIKALHSPTQRPPELNLNLRTSLRSGNLVLRSSDLDIGFPNAPLFDAEPIRLERQECAALIGGNGTGKTTFLRTLMGELEPLSGDLHFGASLKLGYFAQAHDGFDPNNRVIDELLNHKFMLTGQARDYLAQYLFRGEDVFKPIHQLSGGERGRLALALLALEGANFLLLDEPTNHLDIPAQEVLQEVLEHFDGTILLVSHDRYLVDRLATQIWELRDGHMYVTEGTYAVYNALRESEKEEVKADAATERRDQRESRDADRRRQNEERRRQRELAEIEETIHGLESMLSRLEHDLAKASLAQNLPEIQRLSVAHEETQQRLDKSLAMWEQLAEPVE
jgi:ATP-binding cassette subfamily F protein 3